MVIWRLVPGAPTVFPLPLLGLPTWVAPPLLALAFSACPCLHQPCRPTKNTTNKIVNASLPLFNNVITIATVFFIYLKHYRNIENLTEQIKIIRYFYRFKISMGFN